MCIYKQYISTIYIIYIYIYIYVQYVIYVMNFSTSAGRYHHILPKYLQKGERQS